MNDERDDERPDVVFIGGSVDRPPRPPVLRPALARVDADRRVRYAVVGGAFVMLLAAIAGWLVRGADEAPPASAVHESHGLTPDQAACFAFGRLEHRAATALSDDFIAPRPVVRGALTAELDGLDALPAGYPEADDELAVVFGEVSAASRAYLGERGRRVDEGVARDTALDQAAAACGAIANFDVEGLEPIEGS